MQQSSTTMQKNQKKLLNSYRGTLRTDRQNGHFVGASVYMGPIKKSFQLIPYGQKWFIL